MLNGGASGMETFEARLKRFLFGQVQEIPSSLVFSIANFFLPEIHKAGAHQLHYLVLLGTHAIIQTVVERIFGLRGPSGTAFYLRRFVDAGPPDRTYSAISAEVHNFRNVVAHMWFSSLGHNFVIDYTIPGGFEKRGTAIHLNPAIYLEDFTAGFRGRVWGYKNVVTDDDLLIRKYEFIADWLSLPPRDTIRSKIRALEAAAPGPTRSAVETAIQTDIKTRYSL